MPSNLPGVIALSVPKSGHDGLVYPIKGHLAGHDGEWFRVSKKGRDNYRVIRVGPDGKGLGPSYRVAAAAFAVIAQEETAQVAVPASEISAVAQNGAVVIAARLRASTGILPGTHVIQEEKDGGVLIRPLQPVAGRKRPTADDLDRLLAGITPENRHEEFDMGSPVGREIL